MKIIQINAWLGRLNTPLTNFIKQEQPDIVCMQEAFAPGSKVLANFQDQYGFVDRLKQAAGLAYDFFAPSWGFDMSGTIIDEGNIILSKYPLSNSQSLHTYNQYHARHGIDDALVNTRVWQACTVELPAGKLSVANYQGYNTGKNPSGNKTTLQTMQKVRDALAQLPHPVIFCGDLNVVPTSPVLQILDDLGLRNLTADYSIAGTLSAVHYIPEAERQKVACDYIFVSDDVHVKKFSVADELVSDHKALILEFDL